MPISALDGFLPFFMEMNLLTSARVFVVAVFCAHVLPATSSDNPRNFTKFAYIIVAINGLVTAGSINGFHLLTLTCLLISSSCYVYWKHRNTEQKMLPII